MATIPIRNFVLLTTPRPPGADPNWAIRGLSWAATPYHPFMLAAWEVMSLEPVRCPASLFKEDGKTELGGGSPSKNNQTATDACYAIIPSVLHM